ncbi:baculoviral IAP repeat-containing protein 3-like [Saccostrea echinata]|uniref:baculoviral IAP repeat-containing protein 3-like n=1 Tax=Saccostrea echinata TaxID=191078 RepID=UPI002A7FB1C1|nr:baculoviral IAP repeat-containing protein 3-like [Saccostrea echinata]
MNYEDAKELRSRKNDQEKEVVFHDDNIGADYKWHMSPKGEEKSTSTENAKCLTNVEENHHIKESCSKHGFESKGIGKSLLKSNDKDKEKCKDHMFIQPSKRGKNVKKCRYHNDGYPSARLYKHVEIIERIVHTIERDVKNVPTVFCSKNKVVSMNEKKQKCKIFSKPKSRLLATTKQTPKNVVKHFHQGTEIYYLKTEYTSKLRHSFPLEGCKDTANQIYRKYLKMRPLPVRYSDILQKIKEKMIEFDRRSVSKNHKKHEHPIIYRNHKYPKLPENLRFLFSGIDQMPNQSIHLFPVFGNARSLDEFVQREITQSKESNEVNSSLHSMNLELIRLRSFHNFPSSKSVSTVKLARQGFYYSGESDTVICFACGFQKSNWRKEDDVDVIHRTSSPACPLLNSCSTSNVQINGNQVNSFDENCENRRANLQSARSENLHADRLPHNAQITNEEVPRTEKDRYDLQNGSVQNHSPSRTSSDQLTRARAQQEKINAFIRELDPLGINFDRPKYPSYAVLAVRISAFADWPSSITQTPRDLAVAGFFYAGYGDYTRCFFCGGGLRNWEPGDDPWTEHARWFPKCAFLRQNKGDEFVALVQIEHQETTEQTNGYIDDQASGSEKTQSQIQNVITHSAFLSLLEMGYSNQKIQEAFDLLKETKEAMHIKAEELLDILLDQKDRNPGDTLPSSASASSELTPNNIEKTSKERSEGNIKVGNDSETRNPENKWDASQSFSSMTLEDTKSLIEENRKLKDLRLCKICLENDASIAMLPCGHLCCCPDCAPAMRKCPICRQFVKGTVKTWLV